MRYAFIFPGQGAQQPGMGREFYDRWDAAKSVFEEADEALGFSLSEIIFDGTPEELSRTEITQPAILTVSIAAFRVLELELGRPASPLCMAGHSLGEYTALVAAGALSLADGVRLVNKRGRLMQNAVPVGVGSMAAVIGLGLPEIEAVCAEASQGEVCQAANINSPKQIVISGHAGAVSRAEAIIGQKYTARVVPLMVSAPFHCELMRGVADELKKEFDNIEWHAPRFPITANFSARAVSTVPEIRSALFSQTYSPVMWSQSVQEMERSGAESYIELGPGSVLSGLVRKICRGRRSLPVSNAEELAAAVEFIKGAEDGE